MSMYKTFQTDKSLENDGIKLQYGESFRVTVARAGGTNKRFAKILDDVTRPYRRAIQTETMDNDRGVELLHEAYAKGVVLNWEVNRAPDGAEPVWEQGIEAPDGSLMPFTVENVVKTFKALPDLFKAIQEDSGRLSLFRTTVQEADAGN